MSESKPYHSSLGAGHSLNRVVAQDPTAQKVLQRAGGQLSFLKRGLEATASSTATGFEAEWQRALEQFVARSKIANAHIDAELQRVGLPEVGNDLEKWEHLARVTEQDPAGLTLDEIYHGALAWVDRQELLLKLAQRFASTLNEEALLKALAAVQSTLSNPVQKTEAASNRDRSVHDFNYPGWRGSNEWKNWGVGLATDGTWHLYHFNRLTGGWVRNRHSTLKLPSGIPQGLARKFLRKGCIGLADVHDVLQKHTKGVVVPQVRKDLMIAKVKAPMSRLRTAIRDAVRNEGHRPKGRPISSPTKEGQKWEAMVRFGGVSKRHGRLYFSVHYI